VSDYYERTGTRPPGGRLRYGLAQRAAQRAEPDVVRRAGHVIAVSPAYPKALRDRYADVPADRFTVLPFAASPSDFDVVRDRGIRQPVLDPADGMRHWVYLGRGGADMAKALRGLFLALRDLRASVPEVARLRLHFVGTSYAPGALAEETVTPVARACGVGDLVMEQTGRVPYLQGLALLRAADAILIVGSDDPGYSASKVYPCVAAQRPILAVLHQASPAGRVITDCRAGEVVGFQGTDSDEDLANRLRPVVRRLLDRPAAYQPETNWKAFEPFTAREMTRRLCEVFDQARGANA
jgi:hypothetical protein